MKIAWRVWDIHVWASVAQILSIFLVLGIFSADHRRQQEQDRSDYTHRLGSLRFELDKNLHVTVGFFKRDRDAILAGHKLIYFRYSVGVINALIGEGKIRDAALLRDLDVIADDENQVNRILDVVVQMGETAQINSPQDRKTVESRIQTASKLAVDLSDQLEKGLPKVIGDIDAHVSNVNSERRPGLLYSATTRN
jgi:hypothetical protein